MKKTRRNNSAAATDLRPEYRFDYRMARPNRFTAGGQGKTVAVLLEPDVAKVFDSSESVNHALRSVLSAIPKQRPSARKPRRKAS